MLSSVPKYAKAMMYLHIICVLHKLHSGMSYLAVGHLFNVNESIRYLYTESHVKMVKYDGLTKML